MKMKVGDIEKTLENLSGLDSVVLPIKINFAISRNKKLLENEYAVYSKERSKLIIECTEKDKSGHPIIYMSGNDSRYKIKDQERLESELGAMQESEVDIDITTIQLSDIEKIEDDSRYTNLSIANMNSLSFMIKEEDDG